MASTGIKEGLVLTEKDVNFGKPAAVAEYNTGSTKTGSTRVMTDNARDTKLVRSGNEEKSFNRISHESGTASWDNPPIPNTASLSIRLSYDSVRHAPASSTIPLLGTYNTKVGGQIANMTALAKRAVMLATQQKDMTTLLTGIGAQFELFVLSNGILGCSNIGHPPAEKDDEEGDDDLSSSLCSAALLGMSYESGGKGENIKVQFEAWITNKFKHQMPITEHLEKYKTFDWPEFT
jgi:hypothetical protein